MEHWWNDGMGEQKYCENTFSRCHFVHHKSERPATIHQSRTTQPVAWCCPRNEPAYCNQFSGKAETEGRNNFANLRYVRPPLETWHGIWSVNLMDMTFLFFNPLTTDLRTYLLPPRSRVLPEKLTGSHLVKEFPAFYGTRRFITAFTMPHHVSLSWASSMQSTPPIPLH